MSKRKKKAQTISYRAIAVVDGSETWVGVGAASDDLDFLVKGSYIDHEDIIRKVHEAHGEETIFIAILPEHVVENSPWDIPKWLNKKSDIQLLKEYHNLDGRRILVMQGKNHGFVFPLNPLFKTEEKENEQTEKEEDEETYRV